MLSNPPDTNPTQILLISSIFNLPVPSLLAKSPTILLRHTERKLKQRHIDLIAIGGSIGTALFVTIGSGLMNGGCGNLLVAFAIHGLLVIYIVTLTIGELVCYLPVDSPFISHAGRFVDPAFEVTQGYNFYIMVYYSLHLLLWSVVTHSMMCLGSVTSKVLKMRSQNISGASAFWAAYLKAVFTEAASEYLGMVTGEAQNSRKAMPRAFKGIIYRLSIFFVLGALSVGILLRHDDITLVTAVSEGAVGANVSPYVIAMQNMSIKVLPHIVNVLCITSSFSAGNSYIYCSSRSLYAMAKSCNAPKIFKMCFKNGVPIFCVMMAIAWSILSLLQLGDTASSALDWMVNLCTGCQVLNYFFMMITYLCFYRACKVQGVSRFTMPLQAWTTKLQPYPAIFGLFTTFVIVMFLGCQAFIPSFNVNSFLYYYLMVFVDLGIFVTYKIVFRTKFVKPEETDLFTGLAEVDEHEREFYDKHKEDGKSNNFMFWLL